MSSLDYTYENIDKVIDRSRYLAPTIDPKKTMLLVLDMQKACAEPGGAMYIPSVGGAPEGKDTIEPVKNVLEACRAKGIPVVWSLWGLRGDGKDAATPTSNGVWKASSAASRVLGAMEAMSSSTNSSRWMMSR